MIIVRLSAGLGNQMFQYALYRALLHKGYDCYLDITTFDKNVHNGYELNNIFNITERIASNKQIKRLRRFGFEITFSQRIVLKLTKSIGKNWRHLNEDEHIQFNPKILQLKGSYYLNGYWQSEKYFKQIENIIRKEFTFKNQLNNCSKNFLNEIKSSNSVAIHVRRGDYINHPLHGNIATLNYYKNAINIIKSKLNNPFFYIFSDDPKWCKEKFNLINSRIVDCNTGNTNYFDLQLMSMCKNIIIANSSFSWWAAWLNKNYNKLVIAPKKWFNDPKLNSNDIYIKDWICI